MQKGSRVTAMYDIHGNLPALEAVLADLESVSPDLIVVGGDVVAGPMPTEVMDCFVTLGKRVVNTGSVGMPYQGKPVGAFWLLLGADGVSLRRSDYDLDRAVERIRATGYPEAEDMAEILLEPPNPERVADFFEQQAAGD